MQQSAISVTLKELRAQTERIEKTSMKGLEKLKNEILDTLGTVGPAALSNQVAEKSKRAEPGNSNRLHGLRAELLNAAKKSMAATRDDKVQTRLYMLLNAFIGEGRELATTLQILESLYFRELREREFNVKKSHASTYHWIFAKDGPFKQLKFMDWLEKGSNIYWITGKAGSGKSTLMKLISNHPRVCDALQTWADKETSIVASHFFWNGGIPMQKSQTGLLRSLLYQILRQYPALIRIACPDQWHADEPTHLFRNGWSDEELSMAFKRLSEQRSLSVKICIFVDGLDEYHGEHRDVISIL